MYRVHTGERQYRSKRISATTFYPPGMPGFRLRPRPMNVCAYASTPATPPALMRWPIRLDAHGTRVCNVGWWGWQPIQFPALHLLQQRRRFLTGVGRPGTEIEEQNQTDILRLLYTFIHRTTTQKTACTRYLRQERILEALYLSKATRGHRQAPFDFLPFPKEQK